MEEGFKDFKCPLKKLAKIEDWVKEEDEKNCHPCLLSPIAGFYVGILQEAGEGERANRLQEVFDSGDQLTIARELDKIKTEVGDNIKSDLEKVDCMAQTFEG